MPYLMRQKFLSWGEEYRIKDDTGQAVFLVKGKLFRAKKKFSFQDMQENELAVIQQKSISMSIIYEIYRDSEVYATMSESFFTLIGLIPGFKFAGNAVTHLEVSCGGAIAFCARTDNAVR